GSRRASGPMMPDALGSARAVQRSRRRRRPRGVSLVDAAGVVLPVRSARPALAVAVGRPTGDVARAVPGGTMRQRAGADDEGFVAFAGSRGPALVRLA